MPNNQKNQEFQVLQRIDGRLERIETRFAQTEHKAIKGGAIAGALAGGLVACGVVAARLKLGM
ncbi:MAG: hypothetical protein RBR45_14335 [Pseudomonas sp.]|jgi:hypothetical protein|nr:hypothetical protein [Pseudomonas sp.]